MNNVAEKVDSFLEFIGSKQEEINEIKREKAIKKFNELNNKMDICIQQVDQLNDTYSNTKKCVREYKELLQDPENWTLSLIEKIMSICLYVEYQLGTHRGL